MLLFRVDDCFHGRMFVPWIMIQLNHGFLIHLLIMMWKIDKNLFFIYKPPKSIPEKKENNLNIMLADDSLMPEIWFWVHETKFN